MGKTKATETLKFLVKELEKAGWGVGVLYIVSTIYTNALYILYNSIYILPYSSSWMAVAVIVVVAVVVFLFYDGWMIG